MRRTRDRRHGPWRNAGDSRDDRQVRPSHRPCPYLRHPPIPPPLLRLQKRADAAPSQPQPGGVAGGFRTTRGQAAAARLPHRRARRGAAPERHGRLMPGNAMIQVNATHPLRSTVTPRDPRFSPRSAALRSTLRARHELSPGLSRSTPAGASLFRRQPAPHRRICFRHRDCAVQQRSRLRGEMRWLRA